MEKLFDVNCKVNENIFNKLNSIAEYNGISVSDFFYNLLIERIEDEIDKKEAMEFLKEKENGTLETYDYKEVFKELGFDV